MAKAEKGKDRKKLIRKLKNKYRLVVINDATFDERFSLFLSPLNVISAIAIVFFSITLLVASVIAFTPIREYIPGYSDTQTRLNALNATLIADSLERAQGIYKNYFDNVQRILNGEITDSVTYQEDSPDPIAYSGLDFSVSAEDSLLRKEIESRERYALNDRQGSETFIGLPGVLFFAPVRGEITASFNSSIEHYGVDVTANEGEPIKAVYDGVVILSSYTSDGGYVIQIQHPDNLISVYKHNSVLLKNVGERVNAGESIAIIGNSGEFTDGPHLHFELWHNGNPLDPQDFIAFSS